jgi:hypothetical protein
MVGAPNKIPASAGIFMTKSMKTYICINCQLERKFDNRNKNKYCSIKCQQDFQYKERIAEWKITHDARSSTGSAPWLKRYLFEKQDGKCSHCKNTHWLGKLINLDLEHIDGNSDNDHEDNVELICPNCHSYTPTYKGANRGNGRHARRERYKEGKSF